jgi:hypothetical protein
MLSGGHLYTTLDNMNVYNMIRIAKEDEWKTAFTICYGLFESLVIRLGQNNPPAFFKEFINDILHPWLIIFCTALLDNILIYSNSIREHKEHIPA